MLFTYVALVEEGIPKFSAKPVNHRDLRTATAEARRRATVHRGSTFAVFTGVMTKPQMVPPRPKERTYTYEELWESAPVGHYKSLDDRYLKAEVVTNGGARAAFFGDAKDCNLLSRTSWVSHRFAAIAE